MWLRLITTVVILISSSQLRAQQNTFYLNELGTDQGLASENANHYIFRDSHDVIWVSSQAGTHRFYGQHLKTDVPLPEEPDGIRSPHAATSNYAEDIRGDVWFCNDVGLVRYDRQRDKFQFYQFRTPDGDTVSNYYYWLHYDATDDLLYVGAGKQLYRCSPTDPERAESILALNVTPGSRVMSGPGDALILGIVPSGEPLFYLARYQGSDAQPYTLDTIRLPGKQLVSRLYRIPTGPVIVGTESGLLTYFPVRADWGSATGLPGKHIRSIQQNPDGSMLVGTLNQGLFSAKGPAGDLRFTPLTLRLREEAEAYLPEVRSLTVDRRGVVWISDRSRSVKYFSVNKPKFTRLGEETSGRGGVKSIARSKAGWWTIGKTTVTHHQSPKPKIYPLPISGEDAQQTKFVYEDSLGGVWAGTLSLLFYKAPQESKFRAVDVMPSETANRTPGFNCVTEPRAGELWLGTNARGLLGLRYTDAPASGRPSFISRWLSEASTGCITLFRDADRLLAATTSGEVLVGSYQLDTIIWTKRAVINTMGTQFARTTSGNGLYLASFGGLFLVENSKGYKPLAVSKVEGPGLQEAESVFAGSADELWLAGAGGLSCYLPEEQQLMRYSVTDGAYASDYQYGAVIMDSSGRILFGATEGITLIPWGAGRSRLSPARPTIIDCTVNGIPKAGLSARFGGPTYDFTQVSRLVLPYSERDIFFRLGSLEYAEPKNCTFAYRLDGDGNGRTVALGTDAELEFRSLATGNYSLTVMASNADGVLSEKTHQLNLTILPPWYRTWWAYTLYALAIAALAFAFFWVRLQGIRKTEREQLRAAKAEALAAETETSVLRLQMNPHFIFNSLNAVNAYILKGDKLKAHEYLVQFADLIREILNRSAQPLTRLDLAIDLLLNYLEAERMRVGEKLTYSVEIDDELDTFTTFLPTMILQPFVENAIWHGISGLPEGGKITLRFRPYPEKGILKIEVEDNGRGRAVTTKRTRQHRSMAMDITRRRLEILNTVPASLSPNTAPAAAPPNARYEIEDRLHPDGTPAGTRVVLYLSLDYPREYASSND